MNFRKVERHEWWLWSAAVSVTLLLTAGLHGDEYDGLEYTLYHLAGAAHFGRGYVVEALHLTDETMEAVQITARKLGNRHDETDTILAGIKTGTFPTKINPVTCPRCPHFFICPAAPKGPLTLS